MTLDPRRPAVDTRAGVEGRGVPMEGVVVVVGATASGKSRLAAQLAAMLGRDVVNADALQLYRELQIGVAKPEADVRRLAPHHLFEEASVCDGLSAGEYVRRARGVLAELAAEGRGAVVVGGTGLYVEALLHGIDVIPDVPLEVRTRVRALIARRGPERAHRLLARVDPPLAARLPPGDRQRIARGLEVAFGTGRRLSELQRGGVFARGRGDASSHRAEGPVAQAQGDLDARVIGVRRGRADLADRIARRVWAMWQEGLLDEARRLVALGMREAVEARKPIGYREAFAVLDGRASDVEAKRETVRRTLALAKRQETWWRRRGVAWVEVAAGEEPSVGTALAALRALSGQPDVLG